MQIRKLSYSLLLLASIVLILSGWGLHMGLRQGQRIPPAGETRMVQAHRPAIQRTQAPTFPPPPQVVMGTPEVGSTTVPRYTYRNEYPEDRTQLRPLYLIDTETGQETRLGDDSHAALFGTLTAEYLLWLFDDGLHAYHLADGKDILVAKPVGYSLHPQIADDWVAYGRMNADGSSRATLYAANLQTREVITLTQQLEARDALVNGYFGISARLVAWYDPVDGQSAGISVYDLERRAPVARLTGLNSILNDRNMVVYDLTPGETVVTWSGIYGYDLVTQSYFRTSSFVPPNWVRPPTFKLGRITEQGLVLSYILYLKDGTELELRAPLLDATPSTAPCVESQNLVQNGDLEDIGTHNLWQQSGSLSDLIVNDLPPNAPQGGQWAVRLGRYSNAQPSIQQILSIPSHVKGITLSFDVRANSWDIWGGDQLQVDLIDPVTNQSILVTPVQWTNVQLNTGNWVPLQVTIQGWPGIDTPLQLVLRAQTDWAFPTDFTIDNIRLLTRCA